jgi:GNAT superfamily N-acetyltransferase
MNLKHATQDDVEFIVGAAEDTHKKFGGIDFDRETTLDTIDAFLHRDLGECMLVVAYTEEKYHGVVAGMLSLTPFSHDIVANEPLFWTDGNPKAFKLLSEAYSTWAEKAGAKHILISAPPNRDHKKVSRFYSKLGYEPYEYVFMKGIN